jgi:hypothetical protein
MLVSTELEETASMTTVPPPSSSRVATTWTATSTATGGAGAAAAADREAQTFLLLALQPSTRVGWRIVGRYPDYPSAQRAHVDDVLAQLDGNDGWLLTCEHLLIGPDLDGSIGCWPQLVSVGADPSSDRIPDPYDRAGWQHWLECTHLAAGLE